MGLFRNDGRAVATGYNSDGQCNIRAMAEGELYAQISAGGWHGSLKGQWPGCDLWEKR